MSDNSETEELKQQLNDAREWINVLGEQLLVRETQIAGIKDALGEDAAYRISETLGGAQ
jgi:hypothetical protein